MYGTYLLMNGIRRKHHPESLERGRFDGLTKTEANTICNIKQCLRQTKISVERCDLLGCDLLLKCCRFEVDRF